MTRRTLRDDVFARYAAATDLPLLVLSLVWLPVLIVPLVISLPGAMATAFNAVDYSIWALFVVDYSVRLYLAPSRREFFIHHLIDLAVIALPMLRPLRALRLLRLLTFARAGLILLAFIQRLRAVLTHRGIHIVLLVVLAIVAVAAGLELGFERGQQGSNIQSYGDAIWWAVVTVTTVGYGDRFPVTAGGRGVAVAMMVVGIGLLGALTATIASYFVEEQAAGETADLRERLVRIETLLTELGARFDESTSGTDPIDETSRQPFR